MKYYLFGSKPSLVSYPETIGSFNTESEAQECKLMYEDAGWTGLEIQELDWI